MAIRIRNLPGVASQVLHASRLQQRLEQFVPEARGGEVQSGCFRQIIAVAGERVDNTPVKHLQSQGHCPFQSSLLPSVRVQERIESIYS
ncbi:hypothetical protein [Neptuniibacter sp.]|uniref:hypothetical protein n=1 Tax=Neptuniibacter sp. TaxID=1962643 RepID=UPI002610D5CF|nr:hypothetical protein [Neptuniibacter sp.]MCP4596429.1 hypothetical protein [Neptuniibacter sp.]